MASVKKKKKAAMPPNGYNIVIVFEVKSWIIPASQEKK